MEIVAAGSAKQEVVHSFIKPYFQLLWAAETINHRINMQHYSIRQRVCYRDTWGQNKQLRSVYVPTFSLF